MKITRIFSSTFSGEDSVLAATSVSKDKFVFLTGRGNVFIWHLQLNEPKFIFSIKDSFTYADGGFDVHAPVKIIAMDGIVAVYNDNKTQGRVYIPGIDAIVYLYRGGDDLHVTPFPIALYKDDTGVPHLIYSKDRNHVQVMNLDTLQILTADKSLIEVDAESAPRSAVNGRMAMPWPQEFDYWYCQLQVSPDGKRFLSRGWVWGSKDAIMVFELDHFLNSNRIQACHLMFAEHENRAACWLDSETIAFLYHPAYDDEHEVVPENREKEIRFVKYTGKNLPDYFNRFVIDEGITLNCDMQFSQVMNALVLLCKNTGLWIYSLSGEVLLHDGHMKQGNFNPELNMLITLSDKTVSAYTLG